MERLAGQRFTTRREAQDEALAWIRWYNQTRMHSTLGYVSPAQFEMSSSDAEKQNGDGSKLLRDTETEGKVSQSGTACR